MSGAFKATSFPALDVEMHLIPIEQQIRKHNLVTIGRITNTADPQQPDITHGRTRRRSPRERTKQELQRRPSPDGGEQEMIQPFVISP
jgi:hypothetical protein